MTTMPAAYAAKDALLHELQQPRLLQLHLPKTEPLEYLAPDFFFHPFASLPGLESAHLLAPPGCSALLVRGAAGTRCPVVAVDQQVRMHVLHGRVRWWQNSWKGPARELVAGDWVLLAPGETHGFEVLEDMLNYSLMVPAL